MIYFDDFDIIFLSTMIVGYIFSIIVLVITFITCRRKQKKIKCSEKECRFYDEYTGCILGWGTADSCPYMNSVFSGRSEKEEQTT